VSPLATTSRPGVPAPEEPHDRQRQLEQACLNSHPPAMSKSDGVSRCCVEDYCLAKPRLKPTRHVLRVHGNTLRRPCRPPSRAGKPDPARRDGCQRPGPWDLRTCFMRQEVRLYRHMEGRPESFRVAQCHSEGARSRREQPEESRGAQRDPSLSCSAGRALRMTLAHGTRLPGRTSSPLSALRDPRAPKLGGAGRPHGEPAAGPVCRAWPLAVAAAARPP